MDEREPDSNGRPLTRREMREREVAATATAAGVEAEPVDEAVAEAQPAEVSAGVDWGSQVRWALRHDLPALLPDESDDDDVRWEPRVPAPSAQGDAGPEPVEPTSREPGSGPAAGQPGEPVPGPEPATAALPQVEPPTGGVPRRRSVWLMGEQGQVEPTEAPTQVAEAPTQVAEANPQQAEPGPPLADPEPVDLSEVESPVGPALEGRHTGPAAEAPDAWPSDPFEPTSLPEAALGSERGLVPQVLPAAPLPTLSDLLAARPIPPAGPAQLGWQGAVRRLTGGLLRLHPGPTERAHRAAVGIVQRPLDGPRTVVVINPKGGAHKTTGTLLLAAAFGQHRGGYTLAWDNNETRGTLGWRSMPGTHQRTAVDLLQNLDRFAEGGVARVGDLDSYVRSQASAQFDVLASDEDAASAASIDAAAFRALHSTLSRFYRVMVIDTGNNMRASNWQAAIEAADQVVIVSTVREDTAQSAAWAIDALRATGHGDVVRNAVTVLSDPAPQRDATLAARLHEHFGQLTRVVVDVPYDRSLVGGTPLEVERLNRRTREAWLRVAAAVAEGL